jgi:ketosteroid isomerase-like protein
VREDNVATPARVRRVHDARHGRQPGALRAEGVPEAHLWELRDGKVVRFTVYIDTPAMLAALRS